ncbi:ClpP/crotonase [Wallemia mellicola]|uniref:ClpP/crotonase n=1 Tax=Wallemia mellicola TaxID=1708541 RepID=A0A4T0PZ12_9BASI|nr:ClpP/crotonase [Wallemia mellicola]TIC16039.1 ClpP/crotonase [Wallemia mellicola]TIC34194.1 ClpP/crotonase [Wallemia mellicola]
MDNFKLNRNQSVLTICFNSPVNQCGRHSAIVCAICQLIQQANDLVFKSVNNDTQIRAVILIGNGKAFSSGLDMNDAGALLNTTGEVVQTTARLRQHIVGFQDAITAIETCAVPVIAALHGLVLGLGIDIASACDIRYAACSTRFSIKEIDLGLAADIGTLQRFPRAIGNDALARELAYTGRQFNANEALQMGFLAGISCTSSRETVLNMSMGTALAIASKSPVAVQSTKKILLNARDNSVADSLAFTATHNSVALQSGDVKEALSAHLEKRKPVFRDSRM